MTFIHVIGGDIDIENVEQFGPTNSEEDRLRNARGFVWIVKTMTDRLREVVVLRNVRCQRNNGAVLNISGSSNNALT